MKSNTKIRMFDGTVTFANQLNLNDKVMGVDNTPRIINKIVTTLQPIYEVKTHKSPPIFMSANQKLNLVCSGSGSNKDGDISHPTISQWLKWDKTKKKQYKSYRTKVNYPRVTLPLSPYFLGILLSDGSILKTPKVTTSDAEVAAECYKVAKSLGLVIKEYPKKGCTDYRITSGIRGNNSKGKNTLKNILVELGIWGKNFSNKYIPSKYMTSSRDQRLRLLAGLLDGDGTYRQHSFNYTSVSELLATNVRDLALSLGYYSSLSTRKHKKVYEVYISGDCSDIPTKIPRKIAADSKKGKGTSVLRSSIVNISRMMDISQTYTPYFDNDKTDFLLDNYLAVG